MAKDRGAGVISEARDAVDSQPAIAPASPADKSVGVSPQLLVGCLYLFAAPFCAFGLYALAMALRSLLAADIAGAAYAGVFGVSFSGAGFGLVYALRRGMRAVRVQERMRAENPDRPWLWREDWAAGRIPASGGALALILAGSAVLCLGVSIPAIYAVPRELARHNAAILMILLFPFAGLVMLVQAVRAAARWRVVRGAAFELDTLPGQIGGSLAGRIVLPAGVVPSGEFTVALRCVNRVTTNSGDSSSTWEHVLWTDERAALSDGAAIPVAFYIASDPPASDYRNARNQIIWRMTAAGPTSAGKFDAQFEVPVFKVAETAEQERRAEEVRAEEHRQLESYVHPAASRIAMRLTPGGATEVYFPPLRSPGAALGIAVFIAIWSAILWFVYASHAPRIFLYGWAFFDAILMLMLLSMLAAVRVRVGMGEITIDKSVAGMVYSRRRIRAGDVKSVSAIPGMTVNNEVYSQLHIAYGADRTFDFADGIRDKREADWLADQIAQRLELKQ